MVDVELSFRPIVLGSEWMHFVLLVMKTSGCVPTNRDLLLTLIDRQFGEQARPMAIITSRDDLEADSI
jgi:hypothetical protein